MDAPMPSSSVDTGTKGFCLCSKNVCEPLEDDRREMISQVEEVIPIPNKSIGSALWEKNDLVLLAYSDSCDRYCDNFGSKVLMQKIVLVVRLACLWLKFHPPTQSKYPRSTVKVWMEEELSQIPKSPRVVGAPLIKGPPTTSALRSSIYSTS